MSKIQPSTVTCPGCGHRSSERLFESLNGDRIPPQVELILAGTFEQVTCSACALVFQPEHHMLFAQYSARMWIVMYPLVARSGYAELETQIARILEDNFAGAPPAVEGGLRGVRPQLVFGQYGLAEAVRAQRAAIDPPLLECAKLLAYRSNLSQLFAVGPSELVLEHATPAGELVFGVRALATGQRLGELTVPGKLLGDTQQQLPQLRHSHPDLFERPYVSALRYLYAGQL